MHFGHGQHGLHALFQLSSVQHKYFMHIEESAFHSLNRANQGHAPTHPPDSETFLPCYTFLGITQPRTSFWGDGALRSKYCTFTFLPRQCETMFHNPTVRLISTRSSMPIQAASQVEPLGHQRVHTFIVPD